MTSDRRLHPAFVPLRARRAGPRAGPAAHRLFFAAGSAGLGWQIWFLWLLIPYTFVAIGRTLTFRYRYDEHELVIRTGFLFRNERHVPYARIQNVDGVQTVFHRLLKVVDVKVQTAGGNEPEATMSVLPVEAFEEMRRRVFEGRRSAEAPATDVPEPEAQTLLRLSPRDLLAYGFVEGRGLVVIAAMLGLIWEFGVADSFMPQFTPGPTGVPNQGAFRALANAIYSQTGGIFESLISTAMTVVVLLLFVRVLSMAWAAIRLHGFRLTRAEEDLRIEYGLLTHIVATVPLRRIQTLTLREGPLHRLIGRVSARVDTAGGAAGEKAPPDRQWLAPIVRRGELPALLRNVLPILAVDELQWQRVHPRAGRRIAKEGLVLSMLLCGLLSGQFGWWTLASLVVTVPLSLWHARMASAALCYAVTDELVAFRSGWIWRQTTIAPFARVQAVTFRESPFDRRSAMARVTVDTAGAGDLSHKVAIPYLARDVAHALWQRLAGEAAARSFRWS